MFAPSHAHAPWQINAFVRDHKSLEVEALYAQAPTRTRTYQMFRVCKPPLSSLLHFPAISNRSMAILARLQFLQYEALDLDSAFRELLHHASAVRAPGQQGGLVRGQTVLHRGASGQSFYSDFRRSARAASRSYSSAIRSMDALACGMTDKPSAIRRISSERMCQ
jgi:hypothetical protein